MHPLIDTALLKHHRVDYSARVHRDGARARRSIPIAFWAILAIAPLVLTVTTLAS